MEYFHVRRGTLAGTRNTTKERKETRNPGNWKPDWAYIVFFLPVLKEGSKLSSLDLSTDHFN